MGTALKEAVRKMLPEPVLLRLSAVDHYLNGERELRVVTRLCPAGRVAVDVGANIGTYTWFLGRVASRVHAYEPNPSLAERLGRLFPHTVVRNVALSDCAGRMVLRIPVHAGRVDHELGSVCQSFADEAEIVTYTVEARPLDAELLDDVGFIKVDAEQHEVPVLRGALNTIRRCRPVIMSEVTPLLYPRPMPEHFGFLLGEDYTGWFRFDGRYLPFESFDPEVHANPAQWGRRFMGGNVFFLPRENSRAAQVLRGFRV